MSLYAKENADFFRQSIESLRNQTVCPDQIVLVLDGPISTKLKQVVQQYRDLLTIVPLPKNHGLGTALRVGLDYCTNELVARMDTDDLAVSQRMETQVAFMKDHPHIDVVGGAITEFQMDPNESNQRLRQVPLTMSTITQFAQLRNPMNHMTVMFRKQSVLKAGNYRSFPGFEDYNLWVRMLQNGATFTNLPDVLVRVRIGNAMVTRRKGLNYILCEYRFQRFLYDSRFIGKFILLRNLVLRCGVRILPSKLLQHIYANFVRQKN
ncbi:glycosyltransferase [Lactiplantibacillus xiangfangensis]|uniref:Glycosyltransferase n=2 Tax=Lactiplantibacillus xiangfangensis TaxID=942150 RepID=A0A0R2M0Z3_9LACO|nr:glycosyltransferase [Lactiplantibacillus xiangfangensis]